MDHSPESSLVSDICVYRKLATHPGNIFLTDQIHSRYFANC